MLHFNAIDAKTLALLRTIQNVEIFKNLRLAGGTSLALQIGHRISVDLDLFGELNSDRIQIIEELKQIGQVQTLNFTDNIHVFLLDGIKIDIVNYPYPWLEQVMVSENLYLSGIKDIAAMKLAAISGRGTMKDFIDLYFLLKQFSLQQMISFYEEKYVDGSVFLVLKSLAYFDDADQDVIPKMLKKVNWVDIKTIILKNLNEYIQA